jgi:hypothetical protein
MSMRRQRNHNHVYEPHRFLNAFRPMTQVDQEGG